MVEAPPTLPADDDAAFAFGLTQILDGVEDHFTHRSSRANSVDHRNA
jgi:hypothetical protein